MSDEAAQEPHRRRPRYSGKNPRRFEEKYKERNPGRYAETVAKVLASGKTPAGMHRPIMVAEILDVLAPKPGEIAVDCTLGYGGHAREILVRIQPGGRLIGLDADPIELPKTEARLRVLGFEPETFCAHRSNFAGLSKVLASEQLSGADVILADLGVSSMQLDDPARGFSMKLEGPLDMRMNPARGQPASALVEKIQPDAFAHLLEENADEPHSRALADALAGRHFTTTTAFTDAIQKTLPHASADECDDSVRRVFQALRIAVNDEFSALETFLRNLPAFLNPGGRVAILTFHSDEDRRVKKAFESGLRAGFYSDIAKDILHVQHLRNGMAIRARNRRNFAGREKRSRVDSCLPVVWHPANMRAVKRPIHFLARWLISTILIAGVCSVFAAVPFDSATVTRVENNVAVGTVKDGKVVSKRAAAVSDVVKANHFVQTASESRAELEFKDKSLVRVGQNSIFTFDASSRTLTLQKGDMLFYVPPGSGGGTIKTPAITAAITGTLCKMTVDLISVLRGSILVTFNGEQIRVTAGWTIQIINGKAVVYQSDKKSAPTGKLYNMGPLQEDPGIQIAEDRTELYIPDSHKQNAQDSGQVNHHVNQQRTGFEAPVTIVAGTPPPTPRPKPTVIHGERRTFP